MGAVNAASAAHVLWACLWNRANPELPALVGHTRQSGQRRGCDQSVANPQPGHPKQRDHRNAERQVWQCELRNKETVRRQRRHR